MAGRRPSPRLRRCAAAGGLPRKRAPSVSLARVAVRDRTIPHLYPIASRPFGGKGWRFHISAAVMAPRSRGTITLNLGRSRRLRGTAGH